MEITLALSSDRSSIIVTDEVHPTGILIPLNSLTYSVTDDGRIEFICSVFISNNTYSLSEINGGAFTNITDFRIFFQDFFLNAGLASGRYSGWANYQDTQYTEIEPFLLTADNKVSLPNNSGIVLDGQKPIDIASFYTAGKITGRTGDGLNATIEFKIKPTTSTATKITVGIDIGGSIGEIFVRDFFLTKGNGIEHYYLSSFDVYTLDTWEANGGTVKIVTDHPTSVYDIRYLLTRTHKAR